MKGDFTKFTFDPKKHYTGVFKQQGRVDLDADWNEYVEMREHLEQIALKDIIGNCGIIEDSNGFEITLSKKRLYKVFFVDKKYGWIAGESGTILATKDGGKNWLHQACPVVADLTGILFTDRDNGWIVGDHGTILATTNGGQEWKLQASPVKKLLGSIFFTGPDDGWIVGWGGTILKTIDRGRNWIPQNNWTGNYHLNSIFFTSPENGWIVGRDGTILRTTDRGDNWIPQDCPVKEDLYSVCFSSPNDGWIVGSGGTILRLKEDKTWKEDSYPTDDDLYSISFAGNECWITGANGRLLISKADGGIFGRFENSSIPQKDGLFSIFMVDQDIVWIVGGNSTIIKVKNSYYHSSYSREISRVILSPYNLYSLIIPPDRMYVDGILAELDEYATYWNQADYPSPSVPSDLIEGRANQKDLIYLDVWRRHITAVEDPEIREKALGGPDTATRVKTISQVKILEDVGDATCLSEIPGWPPERSKGRLSVYVDSVSDAEKPCDMPPSGGYQGLENRLYRVEIHEEGDAGSATFKWSRDNGSVVFPIEEFGASNQIKLKRLGRDQTITLHKDDWVEISDDVSELSGLPGTMARVYAQPDQSQFIVTLDRDILNYSAYRHAKVRRWDQKSDAIEVTIDSPIDLEDGIRVQFSGSNFKTGDYWVFAARTTGEVEELVYAPPKGIEHHYCKLALIKWTKDEDGSFTANVTDCRKKFKPLTESGSSSCCTVTVGDGKTSKGDYNDIQEAINFIREKGAGRVCILPGSHKLLKTIEIKDFLTINEEEKEGQSLQKQGSLTIYGCGAQTHIIGSKYLDHLFLLEKSSSIQFKSLSIEVEPAQNAILAKDCDVIEISGCKINVATGKEKEEFSLLDISQCRRVTIENSIFLCQDIYKYVAVYISGKDILFFRNKLDGVGVWLRGPSQDIIIKDNSISRASAGIVLDGKTDSQAQIERTCISDNSLVKMKNSGICTVDEGNIDDLIICHNRIVECAQGGVDDRFHKNAVGGIVLHDVSKVQICGNHISKNGQKPVIPVVQEHMIDGDIKPADHYNPSCGIFVHMCRGLEITGNQIIDNGIPIQPDGIDDIYQAGIVALNVTEEDSFAWSLGQIGKDKIGPAPFKAGFPAALITNNVVVVPSGHALIIIGSGQMLIESNALTSKGRWSQPKFLLQTPKLATLTLPILDSDINSCVFILNLGLSLIIPHLAEFGLSKRDAVILPTAAFVSASSDALVQSLSSIPLNGNVLFQGNQVTLNVEEQIDSTLLDFNKISPKNFYKLVVFLIIYSMINQNKEEVEALQKKVKDGIIPDDIRDDISNVVVNTIETSVFIASLDDISFQNNQVTSVVRGKFLMSDVIAAAPTIRASGNRLSEEPLSFQSWLGTLFSLCSAGVWNMTKENQANNCLKVLGTGSHVTDNQIIFKKYCPERLTIAEFAVEGEAIERPAEVTEITVVGEKYGISNLYDLIPGTLASVMLSFADEHAKSAERLNIAAARIKEVYPPDHPILSNILRRASKYNEMDKNLRITATELAGIIKTGPIDWTTFFRAMNKYSKPV